jgi:uncharacterized protein YjbI with pentapeptide repeats
MSTVTKPKFSEACQPYRLSGSEERDRYDNLSFADEECGQDLYARSFFECAFRNMHFTGRMGNMEFADVIFDHCDLSNLSFSGTAFRRVEFRHCRMTGTDLSRCSMTDTLIEGCRCDYVSFSGSKIRRSSFNSSDFSEGAFSDVKLSDLVLDQDRFLNCEFLHTSLQGVDFSECEIGGLLVNPESLRGVIVSPAQAVDLAALLGIVVKQ